MIRTMRCRDCEGRGEIGGWSEPRNDGGPDEWMGGEPCERCGGSGRVEAPEALLREIMRTLKKRLPKPVPKKVKTPPSAPSGKTSKRKAHTKRVQTLVAAAMEILNTIESEHVSEASYEQALLDAAKKLRKASNAVKQWNGD